MTLTWEFCPLPRTSLLVVSLLPCEVQRPFTMDPWMVNKLMSPLLCLFGFLFCRLPTRGSVHFDVVCFSEQKSCRPSRVLRPTSSLIVLDLLVVYRLVGHPQGWFVWGKSR